MEAPDDFTANARHISVQPDVGVGRYWKPGALLMFALLALDLLFRGSTVQLSSGANHSGTTASASFLIVEVGKFRAQILWNFADQGSKQ